jgi:hypothetical protein
METEHWFVTDRQWYMFDCVVKNIKYSWILIRCHYKYLYILYLLYMTYKYSWTSLARIQRNWQHRVLHDEEKQNKICVGHHYTQANTNNVNKLYMTYKYSRTSLARTRMARIPWIARKPIVIAYLPHKQHEVW